MTGPLIDKEELLRIVRHEFELADPVGAADSVIGYLRSVLTPEALDDLGPGIDLYRRIFGEDR